MSRKPKSVYAVVNLIKNFSKLFGMAPYAIRDQKGTPTLEIRKKTIINYSIIVCISATTMYAFMSLILLRHNQRYFSQVNKVVFVLYTLRILSGLITIISMYRNQDALISAYQQLDSFDTRRKSFKEHDYTAVYNVTIFLILSVCFLVIGIELIYYYIMEETLEVVLYDSFSNGFQFLIHLISLLYFELYVVVLTNDFKFVKLIIEKLNHSSKKSNQAPRNAQSTIRAISFMYDDLCKGASHINEVLLGLYLLSDKNTRDAKAIFWTIFYALQQFSILIPPGTVEAEAKELTKYLSEIELEMEEASSNERNNFLLRTLHQSVSFTACGFFPISMSAIIGQFSISISFLLFMFQIIK